MPRWIVPIAALLASAPAAFGATPDPRLAGYRVAPGYKVTIAATEPLVINPVTMTFGLDGRLFVVEWMPGRGPNDRIKVLTDENGDGTFDRADIYMDGLELPAGVLFWDGWTYVTLDHDLVRFKDKDGDGTFEERQSVVTGFGNDDSHHRVSGIAMGPDGWLYLTTGDSDARAKGSDGSEATVLRSGGVFRCKPDGSKLEVFAFGMRNPWGNVAFDDEFHIFHTDNEGAPGFTGCRLLHVVEGGDSGWRLREGARCCQPDFDRATWNGGRPGRLGSIAETGRGAPAGLCVLNSAAFPPSTRNLLVYPDVFRKNVRAYALKPAGATYAVDREFELLASDDPLFRPDDAEVGPDGALYLLDWRTDSGGAGQLNGNGTTGRIYRVTWGGTEKEPARPTLPRDRIVELLRSSNRKLVDAMSSRDWDLGRSAALELIRRWRNHEEPVKDPDEIESIFNSWNTIFGNLYWKSLPILGPKPMASRLAVTIISSTIGEVLPQDGSPGSANHGTAQVRASHSFDPVTRRLGFDAFGRTSEHNNDAWCYDLLATNSERDPQTLRSLALALGRSDRQRRAVPGEDVEWGGVVERFDRALLKMKKAPTGDEKRAVRNDLIALQRSMSSDHLASKLFGMAVEFLEADPFLRDGITRGLEHLGPAGLDRLVKEVTSAEPRHTIAALYALQGWRGTSGATAILKEATRPNDLPTSSRVDLFRALRELGDAVPPDAIAGWLANTPKADPPARAEALRVLAGMGRRAILAAGRVLPAALDDESADVRRAALELANVARSGESKSALIALVKRDDRPVEERRQAVAALRGYEDKGIAPMLVDLASTKNAGLKNEILRALAPLDFEAAANLARSALDDKDRNLRQEAIALLGQRPATALEVARRYNAGKLPPEDLARVIEAVRPHATPELQEATQTLLKNRLLAAPTGAEARRLREFVQKSGRPERGKAVFLDAKLGNCVACHKLEGVGNAVGPDLTRVWETLSFDKRVESILEPSKEIKEGYATTRVATADGRVLSGLLLADTAEAVVLKDAQGREVRIPAKEVEQKGTDPVSLMPAGVVGHLSFADLADLLAFLGDRKEQESLRKN